MTKFLTTSVIAHVDHGKTTFVDSLLAHGGYLSKSLAGDARILDNRKDEQIRGITMKNSIIKIKDHYIIDTPGHMDFEKLIESASILSDCFVLLIDVNEGITPRTYSLIKFINSKKTILVLNKIENNPELTDSDISMIVERINSLLGENIFSWRSNNIILCSATLCAGLAYKQLIPKLGEKNSVKTAMKYFRLLQSKVENNDIAQIVEKYKIKHSSTKTVFQAVFNLGKVVFEILDDIKQENKEDLSAKTELVSTFALTTSYVISRNKVLFVFKAKGKPVDLVEEMILYYGDTPIIPDNIYTVEGEDLINISRIEPGMLVLFNGQFEKNPVITTESSNLKTVSFTNTSYFKNKIILEDYEEKERIIEFFKSLSLTEQGLRVRKNRFCEFEISCFGQIQFEKICEDLALNDFKFAVRDQKKKFIEIVTKTAQYRDGTCEIALSPSEDCENTIKIQSDESTGLVQSVVNSFIATGQLIRENIGYTDLNITTFGPVTFQHLKNELDKLFYLAGPTITPFYYSMKIYLLREYVNVAYTVLQRHHVILNDEAYDCQSDFFIIDCKIPQFAYKEVTLLLRTSCKGTVYVEIEEELYFKALGFDNYIEKIQIEKGMRLEEQIITDATKQRTLKK